MSFRERIQLLLNTLRADNREALRQIRFLFYNTVPNNLLDMNSISFILQTRRTAMIRAIDLLCAESLPPAIYNQLVATIREMLRNFNTGFEYIFSQFREKYIMQPISNQPGVYRVYARSLV